ncbi:major facilitator family transporter [Fusarium denticulatum]|uniref:Major facilitator family transporter n=1 Tax=Fusarium denticulatum TaxID=48507 RepID=A0A8H5UNY8_9HYPO|nr:major facilitator family transporter [Fusarium denticulatum]
MPQSGFQDGHLEAGNREDIGNEGLEKPLSATGTMVDEPQSNPNIVDWDGPDDPQHPLNWSKAQKNLHVGIVSLSTLAANLASTMFAPGAEELAHEFSITNSTVTAMTVNLYVLGFALGPLLLAPLSELYGRLIVYHFCNVVYMAFTIGCAFSTNAAMFLVFRIIAGCAASGPMSIGGGTVADLFVQEQRGKAMALFAVGPLLGPVIGPIIGGFVSENVGWRWTFRILLILSGILTTVTFALMKETNYTVILQKKALRMRKETGNEKLVAKLSRDETPGQMLAHAIVRPLKLLILSPIVLLLSLYTGILFGLIFLLFTTFPSVFQHVYGFSPGVAGLAYLGLGIGMGLGLVTFSVLSDKLLGRKKGDGNAAPRPEDRLLLMKWLGPITPLGLFIYGWTTEKGVHWIVPIIGTFIVGFGSLFVVIPGQIYLVDSFGAEAAASAMAANLLVRSPFGAFLVLTAHPLYSKLGLGWGNSVLGFITIAFTPVPWIFYTYGERLRTHFRVNL